MVGARVRRQQVAYARSRGLSDRRACAVLSVARSTLGYQVTTGRARCPGASRDASVGGPVPALRVSSDSDFPPTGRPCDEPRSGPSTLAARGAAGAPPASPAPRGLGTAPAAAAHRAEPRVGVRLRVRHLCESADAQVPDGRRRVDPRMPGDCRGRRHPLWAGDRGARPARQRARGAAAPAVGQRATSEVKETELL